MSATSLSAAVYVRALVRYRSCCATHTHVQQVQHSAHITGMRCSGSGLHVGHPEGYTATDIIARFKRMTGHNVLHPMGWDAFGLPAEQYALQTGTHPRVTTQKNVDRFRAQLKSLGFSYDWSREISTTDPGYYKWTQWIFTKLLEKDLAYTAEVRACRTRNSTRSSSAGCSRVAQCGRPCIPCRRAHGRVLLRGRPVTTQAA